MLARLRSWWQKASKPLVAAIVTLTVVLLVLLALIILGYRFNWPWVGLRGVTLYSWLQLLIIPAVLAIGGFWFNQIQKDREQKATDQRTQREQKATDQRAKIEQEIARDNQHEVALQSYIDKMSELLLDKGLRGSQPEEEVRSIARVRTLTLLSQLDSPLDLFRKKTVLQFLHESGLIDKVQPIIDLSGAYLSKVYLSGVNLSGANLTHVRLREALLSGVNLRDANLSEADLYEANLHQADLSKSNLSGANLHWADLSGTNLSGANLSRANLSGAFLSGANLLEAYRSGADIGDIFLDRLFEADRNGEDPSRVLEANLSGADLSEANLSEGLVTAEQLAQAKSLKGATMPNGTKHV
jgi:uncharacterized protein YjbI with pentapeptide repeats